MRKRIRVDFMACYGDKEKWSAGLLADENSDSADLIGRAVEKIWGKTCFWFPDSGLHGYGQVFKALRPSKRDSNPGNSAVTYRTRVDIVGGA